MHLIFKSALAFIFICIVISGNSYANEINFKKTDYHTIGWYGLLPVGLDNYSSATCDLDNDGNLDILTIVPWMGNQIDIMYGNGDGTFHSKTQIKIAGIVNCNVIPGDFNDDGYIDFAVSGSSSVTIVINDGDRNYHNGHSYILQQTPFQASGVAYDFNSDGNLDLALKTLLGVQIMFGTGDGQFQFGPFSYVFGVPGAITSIDDANLNGDSYRDIVLTDASTQQAVTLINNGQGKFSVRSSVTVAFMPSTIKAGDIDGSGYDSVVVLPEVNAADKSVKVLFNDGTGKLSQPTTYTGGWSNASGGLADLNDDGFLDIVSVATFTGKLYVLAGLGDGTFELSQTVNTAPSGQAPVIGDFNSDGVNEVAVPGNCPGIGGLLGYKCLAVHLSE